MNCKIPFTKEIVFEKKVSEITSISLEHEIHVEKGMLTGNFIVSGDYKSHEISVNKEPFSYILPFEIELMPDIDEETVEFMIDDFTYEIVDQSMLKVNIDFNVIASKKEVIEEQNDSIFQDASDLFKEENRDLKLGEEVKSEEEIVIREEDTPTNSIMEEEKVVEDILEEEARNDTVAEEKIEEAISEDTIINSMKNVNDEYATYHIHMVSDGESVETICTMYNSNLSILSEYNDLSELTEGDKLIIPEKSE